MDEADAEEGILITPGDDSWREMYSSAEGGEGKLTVRNCLQFPVILGWIDPQGELANPAVIESNDCLAVCTYANHCFVCFHALDPVPGCVADVPDDCFVFYYRLCQGSREHAVTINRGRSNQHLRGSFYRDRPPAVISVVITRPPTQTPWDTISINGFTLRTEPGLFDDHPMLGSALLVDLSAVCALIPAAHLQRIASSTAIFINSAGNCEGMAYHHQYAENEAEKQGCIEVYSAAHYLDSRQHWGPGGMLLHELCHAFHDKCVPDGYQNNDILHVSAPSPRTLTLSLTLTPPAGILPGDAIRKV